MQLRNSLMAKICPKKSYMALVLSGMLVGQAVQAQTTEGVISSSQAQASSESVSDISSSLQSSVIDSASSSLSATGEKLESAASSIAHSVAASVKVSSSLASSVAVSDSSVSQSSSSYASGASLTSSESLAASNITSAVQSSIASASVLEDAQSSVAIKVSTLDSVGGSTLLKADAMDEASPTYSQNTPNDIAADEQNLINNSEETIQFGVAEEVPNIGEKFILDQKIPPNSYRRLTWSSESLAVGFSEATPVLVVNGATVGPTLCLVGAVHGDELNGIEMIRSVIFDIDPAKLTGTVVGVPVANIMGFRRNSRYLPDRRDWNRYFPGNTHGSTASRLAYSFFNDIIKHCDSLVDLHTGSFHRTNLPQLRADLGDENVAKLAQEFGDIAVLNSRGSPSSLRASAVRAGIPAVTMEAGEPQHLQMEIVAAGVSAIKTLLAKKGMYGKPQKWGRVAPVYYRSTWVRANQSGILFSRVGLGKRVKEGEVLGTVTDPITNARTTIVSPFGGRILGMALDQVVLPGFAAYHIGIQTPESILIEESQNIENTNELDEEDGDDANVIPPATPNIEMPSLGISTSDDNMP
jgi:predicted deacylase